MALLDTPLVLFLVAFAFTRNLKLGQALADRLLVGLVSWDSFSEAEVESVVAAAKRGGDAARDAALAELRARKTRVWRCALTGRLPMTQPWFARLYAQALDWFFSQLLGLCSVVALLSLAQALVGTFECLRGGAPSQHMALLAGAALLTALAGLGAPVLRMGWGALQNQLAVGIGALVSVLAGSLFAVSYTGSGELPSTTAPVRRGAGPLLDLGAPLRGALRNRASAAVSAAAVALLVFLGGALFLGPALHVAKFYAERLIEARAGPRPRLARALLRLWWYAPLFAAAAWVRPLGADVFLPFDAVACAEGDIARDCRATLPGVRGGESWLALLPLGALAAALPAGWAPPPLPPGEWLGETAWLRARVAAVLLFVALHGGAVRAVVQSVKDGYWRRAVAAVARATRSDAPPVDARALTRAVEEQRVKAALAPMLTMQVAAVPVSFGALALLLVRLGGLGGVGACAALHGVTGGRLLGLIPRPEQADALLKAMAGKVGVVELLNSRDFLLKTLDAFTSPALWRPVLSFSMFALLVTYALLLELSLLYWRSGGGPEEEGADEEEGGEKKRKGGAAAKAATAAVEEEEEEDEDLPSALISKKEK
jgi:hypothetical protein